MKHTQREREQATEMHRIFGATCASCGCRLEAYVKMITDEQGPMSCCPVRRPADGAGGGSGRASKIIATEHRLKACADLSVASLQRSSPAQELCLWCRCYPGLTHHRHEPGASTRTERVM